MQRKFKYTFLLFSLILLLTNLHLWNVIDVFYLFKDLKNYEIVDVEKNTTKFGEFEIDDKSDEPIYADEGFTEEEIRLFGPLEEREVKFRHKYSRSITKKYKMLNAMPCNTEL